MTKERDAVLREVLSEHLARYSKATAALRYSFQQASRIGIKDSYDDNELIVFDALTSRFIRASDVLMVGVWGALDQIEREERGTFLDRINRAEKRGIISSARDFKDIRDLRNKIVHEYVLSDVSKIFGEALRLTPLLFEAESATILYCERYAKKS